LLIGGSLLWIKVEILGLMTVELNGSSAFMVIVVVGGRSRGRIEWRRVEVGECCFWSYGICLLGSDVDVGACLAWLALVDGGRVDWCDGGYVGIVVTTDGLVMGVEMTTTGWSKEPTAGSLKRSRTGGG
jgi:hypothetical protein